MNVKVMLAFEIEDFNEWVSDCMCEGLTLDAASHAAFKDIVLEFGIVKLLEDAPGVEYALELVGDWGRLEETAQAVLP